MKRLSLWSLTGVVLGSLSLTNHGRAQALPTATGPGSYVAVGAGVATFNSDYGKQQLAGAVVLADVQPHWRVGLEGEARILNLHSMQQVHETTLLGGVRVEVLPRPQRLNPYVKFLAGAGEITLPYGYAHGGFLTYASGAGVDLDLSDRLSLRLLDVEYQYWPSFPYGALRPYGVSTALLFRINSVPHFPNSHRRK